MTERRMTEAELIAAVARLTPPPDHLPPMPAADVLAEILLTVAGSLLDLWTLTDSLHAAGRSDALALVPEIAEHLDATAERLQAVADTLGIRLPMESPLFTD